MMYQNSENKEKIMQRYVDLLKNSGFKAVLGDRNNKDVVMSVINALLPPHRQVTEIEYAPTDYQGPPLLSKEFQYDFLCRGTDGTSFIVEVQRYKDDLDRMCYLLKHMGQFDQQPAWLQQEVYTRIFEACEISGYDDVKLKQFQEDMYDERRLNSELKTARRIGYEEGIAEGRADERTAIAVKLLAGGMSEEMVAEMTGLSPDEVHKINQQ